MSVQRTVQRVDAIASEHVSPATYFDRIEVPWEEVRDAIKPSAKLHANRIRCGPLMTEDAERFLDAVVAAAVARGFAYGHAHASSRSQSGGAA